MDELTWQRLTVAPNRMEADLISSALEAMGIPVKLFQEGAGYYAFPLTFGDLARVEIFVPNERVEDARAWLREYERGELLHRQPDAEEDESNPRDALDRDGMHRNAEPAMMVEDDSDDELSREDEEDGRRDADAWNRPVHRPDNRKPEYPCDERVPRDFAPTREIPASF